MAQVLDFLREIKQNNNTEWFHAHKAEYERARNTFKDLSQVILARKPVNSSFIQEVILIFLCCHFGLSCGLDDWCSLYLQCLHFYYSMTLTNVS